MAYEPDDEMSNFIPDLTQALGELYEMNQELALRMKEELDAAARGEENILLVGTNGDFTVTILHVDPEFLEGKKTEMILLPTSSSISILAAISREYLESKIRLCEAADEDGEAEMADQMWDDFMGELMERAVEMHKKNPCTF